MWSGEPTTGNRTIDGQEHVFPESIGGKLKLPVGNVCKDWNNKLSDLDELLRDHNVNTMLAYHRDPFMTTRIRKKKLEIESIDKSLCIKRDDQGNSYIINKKPRQFQRPKDFDYNFTRAIHKCVANVICYEKGPKYVRNNCMELLEYVKMELEEYIKYGQNPRSWSYAVSSANPFSRLCLRPITIKLGFSFDYDLKKEYTWVCFAHTSGIWLASSQPNCMSKEIITKFSDSIRDHPLIKEIEKKAGIASIFGWNWEQDRELIGELGFIWVKKQIEGKANPEDSFYLLTKCKLCGQINPTGIMIAKTMILDVNQNNAISMNKNSWNCYSIDDLTRMGINIDKWDQKHLERYINTQGIRIPIENDIKKLNISNCWCMCLNCGSPINYNAIDCFL